MSSDPAEIMPISRLFFSDGGPHIVRAPTGAQTPGTFTPARGQQLRDLLGTSIAQLGGVSGAARRKTPPAPTPISIDALLYSGRAALDRALQIRNEVRATGIAPPPEIVDELLDLVALAASE
ncbi:MAG: hypothetical protein ABIR58_07255 [Gemmatimonadaceae bacterium]